MICDEPHFVENSFSLATFNPYYCQTFTETEAI